MNRKLLCLLSILGVAAPHSLLASQAVLHMPLGDPQRRDREVPLVLDGITDTANGNLITPAQLAEKLSDTGILFIGENHTNMDFHQIQFRIIKELHKAGREVLIGLEMFPYTQQQSLNDWNSRLYTEEGFVELAKWYEYWGYNWAYYRDIFLFARENGIKMYAVNTPRAIVRATREKGFDNLTEEEAIALPPQGVADVTDEQREMYKAFFDEDDTLHRAISDEQLEGMFRAQTTWDATMGWNALQALKRHGSPDAIMVVLIGAGHVTFGLGAERQIIPYFEGRISSVIPVPVIDDAGDPVESVRASYANFVWGVAEEADPLFPVLGVSLMGSLGSNPMQIIQVSGDSVGEHAGLLVGDVLLAMDGEPVDSRGALLEKTATYRWGDGKEMELQVPFRRQPD
jgi:aminopeptidase N